MFGGIAIWFYGVIKHTSSPADKKYGSTLPTNKKSETSDANIWPKQQLKYNSFDVYNMKCNFL